MKQRSLPAKALAILLTLLCVLSIPCVTMLQAAAADAKRTAIELNKAVSVSLKVPQTTSASATYGFTAAEAGVYTLKITDEVFKRDHAYFYVNVLNAKGEYLAWYGSGNDPDDCYDGDANRSTMYFVLKKGDEARIALGASAYSIDAYGDYVEAAAGTLVATFKMTAGQVKATALGQGANAVKVTAKAPVGVFSFTPAADGYYSFNTSVGDNMDTYGELYDAKGKCLATNDDAYLEICMKSGSSLECYDSVYMGSWNFNISEPLKAGQVYYLLTRFLNYGTGSFEVNLAPSVLKFSTNNVNLTFHRSTMFTDLIEECTYSKVVLNNWFSNAGLGDSNDIAGYTRGTETLTFSSPDGKVSQDITFKVDYDFLQWCALILCGGFLWLDKTPVFTPGETRWSHMVDSIEQSYDNMVWKIQYNWNSFLDKIDPQYRFHEPYWDDYC